MAELRRTVDALRKELEAVKQGTGEAKSAAADAVKGVAEVKTSAADAKATATAAGAKADEAASKAGDAATKAGEAAAKAGGVTKSDLEAAQKAVEEGKKGFDELKKGTEDGKKAADEGKAKGDTAWMLVSSALVMFMLPGLALFYGGMVRRKNILATMMQSMASLGLVGLYWIAVGYSLAFGPSVLKAPDGFLGVDGGGIWGWSWDLFFLKGVAVDQTLPGYTIPVYVHVMFQGMFAIITPALISGAVAERIRFWPFCVFTILWVTFVYCPLAHMVWAFDWFDPAVPAAKRGAGAIGLLGKMGALDFAGGTVVHIAAGMAGLAACLVLRRRDGYPKAVIHPNGMVLTLLGAGLLWFGWFGFNGGSATSSGAQAASAFAATQAAAAAAGLGWLAVEWLHKGKPTALGLASGIVAGLVAVTPASGYVYVWGGAAIGLAAAAVCYLAVYLKTLLGYDDSLDAFGVHGVGGFLGAVLTGLFCSSAIYPAANDGPFAYSYHRARAAELESKLIAQADADASEAAKAADAAAAAGKAAPDNKDLEKAAADAKDVAADKAATADGLKAELTKLKATIDKQDDTANGGKDKKGPYTQLMIQVKAAGFAVVLALVLSAVLVGLTQALTLGNFTTDKGSETEGLDRTEHGEVGFDYGYATETVALTAVEPKAASVPKGNGRFDLAVEGVGSDELLKNWTALCKPTEGPPDPDFLAVYPHVTTVSGTRFRCRGGDAPDVAARLQKLFTRLMPGKPVKVVRT